MDIKIETDKGIVTFTGHGKSKQEADKAVSIEHTRRARGEEHAAGEPSAEEIAQQTRSSFSGVIGNSRDAA